MGDLKDSDREKYYTLLKLAFSARMTSPSFGVYTERNPKWNPKTFEEHFKEVAKRLEGVIIECLDYAEFIERYDRPWTLFYCDIPYIESKDSYSLRFSKDDHEKLVGPLKNIKGRFIFSYNDHPDIWRLYDGFQFKQV